MDGQLSSLIQVEVELAEAGSAQLSEKMKIKASEEEKFSAERISLQEQLDQQKTTNQMATKDNVFTDRGRWCTPGQTIQMPVHHRP